MFGTYGQGKESLPRVIHVSVARYRQELPESGKPLDFLVTIHEEGTGISWQQNVTVGQKTERHLLDTTQELYLWSLNMALTPEKARECVRQLGMRLHDSFIGQQGAQFLKAIEPTAILFDIDETILNLPWELITSSDTAISQEAPFGRLVTTRIMPRRGRDPLQEDTTVRILAIANPTLDLAATESEVATIAALEGNRGGYRVEVHLLARDEATRSRFSEMLATGDYDILHFAGHASLNPSAPESSALRFADGPLTADDILKLSWHAPPYLVFNSACESGRAVGGKRLLSGESHTNGLAAAFLTAGVYGYAGYFWPVTDAGAGLFAKTFYRSLFQRENVGLAFLDARQYAIQELGGGGDLTGYSAVLFGDAASKHRRDLAMAV